MERATNKLVQIAKRRLMIKAAPPAAAPAAGSGGSSSSSAAAAAAEEAVRMLRRCMDALQKLIRIANAGPSSTALKINHAQCRLLDLQGFHDNLHNLASELHLLLLNPASTQSLRNASAAAAAMAAAAEAARVTVNAEALVAGWAAPPVYSGGWTEYTSAALAACDGGLAAGLQSVEQQWCVAVLEVVTAQLRSLTVAAPPPSGPYGGGAVRPSVRMPYWMVDRVFEVGDEVLSLEEDRGLAMAVRLDTRRLLDKLKKTTKKMTSRRKKKKRMAVVTTAEEMAASYLLCKLDEYGEGDGDDDTIESFVERFHNLCGDYTSWSSASGRTMSPVHFILSSVSSLSSSLDDGKNGVGRGGSFGTVNHGQWLGVPAAVKRLTAVSNTEDFWNEVATLSSVRHPHLAQLLFADTGNGGNKSECEEEEDEDERERSRKARLWTELLDEDLESVLEAQGCERVEIGAAVSVLLQVAEGMAFLHKKGILHRNLHARNVLLVPRHPRGIQIQIQIARARNMRGPLDEFARVKLTDYGLPKTKSASAAAGGGAAEYGGARYWLAPEALEAAKFSKKADVYAFAMLCYRLLAMARPFEEALCDADLVQLVVLERRRPQFGGSSSSSNCCNPYLAAFVQECWSHDPARRPDFDAISCFLRSFRSLLIRSGGKGGADLPFTPPDFANLRARLGGLGFFVRALTASQQAFPLDSFVAWLASAVEQVERDDSFAAAAEIAGDFTANWAGSQHDFEQAVFWYHKAAVTTSSSSSSFLSSSSSSAAAAAAAAARWKLGMCLESGLGIARDERRAVGMYKQAGREGNASAHVELGRCYQVGIGVERSADRAVSHFSRALVLFAQQHQPGSVASSMRVSGEYGTTDSLGATTYSSGATMVAVECVGMAMRVMGSVKSGEEEREWAAGKLVEVASRSRLGRLLVAGHECGNARELVAMLGDLRAPEVSRYRVKLILERLAMEDDILQHALVGS